MALTYHVDKGDAEPAFARASYRRRETFGCIATPCSHGASRSARCLDEAGTRLTVYGAAKIPFAVRRVLAGADGPSRRLHRHDRVRRRWRVRRARRVLPRGLPDPVRRHAAAAAGEVDRGSRENLVASSHARDIDCELEIACERDGTILALRGRAWVDIGAYLRGAGSIATRNVGQFMSGPYRIPNIALESSVLLTNKSPSGTYRGPGRYEADFFRERLLDMAARDLGIDPVEFRRRNLVSEREMPYLLASIRPVEKREELDSGDYRITLERCLAEIKWRKRRRCKAARRCRYHGLAVGCFIEGGRPGRRSTRVWPSSATARSRFSSARLTSGRAWRRSPSRSRPTRWRFP